MDEEAAASQRCKELLQHISLQEELSLDTPINRSIRRDIHALVHADKQEETVLQELYLGLEKKITAIVEKTKNYRSLDIRSKKSRPELHQFRAYELPEILKRYYNLISANPFIWQLVVENIYLQVLSSKHQRPFKDSTAQRRSLQDVEKNAIRYASGYVIRKVMKKYQQRKDMKMYEEFIYCLERMILDESEIQVNDDDSNADSLDDYTKIWLAKTDRGGLVHVTDLTFWLFCEVELLIYDKLRNCFAGEQEPVSAISAFVIEDDDIQYIWSIITVNLSSVEYSRQLLNVIIQEWIVLRGHSLRNTFVEAHKKSLNIQVKKKSLRKELYRQHEQGTSALCN